jgi:hypothetical protein
MTATSYSRLAAVIFAVIAILQLSRAVGAWPPMMVGTATVPEWPSWAAFVVAAGLAWLGFKASSA